MKLLIIIGLIAYIMLIRYREKDILKRSIFLRGRADNITGGKMFFTQSNPSRAKHARINHTDILKSYSRGAKQVTIEITLKTALDLRLI